VVGSAVIRVRCGGPRWNWNTPGPRPIMIGYETGPSVDERSDLERRRMDQAFVADPDFAFRNASQRRRAASPIAFLPAALILRLGFVAWPSS
jgi:hypothetical protein